jgi:hypothetical protein
MNRHRVAIPKRLLSLLFPTAFERACADFMASVLLRSERHLMFLGGYLGVGLVLTAQTAMDSVNHYPAGVLLNADLLAIPFLLSFFIVTGLRFVFDMPAVVTANWVFRSILEDPCPIPRRPVRKILLLSTLTWQLALLLPLTTAKFGLSIAVLHTVVVMLLSITLVEFVLARFNKIPFTCSNRPDMRALVTRILGSVFAVMIFVPVLASMETSMLLNPLRFTYGLILLVIAWYAIWRYRNEAPLTQQCITFEDAPPPAFELLKLT